MRVTKFYANKTNNCHIDNYLLGFKKYVINLIIPTEQ